MSTAPETSVSAYRFGHFVLDVAARQLWRDGRPVPLNSRYFDVLVLLVREPGRVVTKERLFAEVWNDVIVTDAALTQGIKELRKQLGDAADAPQFIRTIPKHGYQFIAEVATVPEGGRPRHLKQVMAQEGVYGLLERALTNYQAHGLLPDAETRALLLAEGEALRPSPEAALLLARSLLLGAERIPDWLVAQLPDASELVAAGLHHPDLGVRQTTVALLARLEGAQALERLRASSTGWSQALNLALLREQAPHQMPLSEVPWGVRLRVLLMLAGMRLYRSRRVLLRQSGGGMVGGAVAGLTGGLLYGLAFAASWTLAQPGPAAVVLLFALLGVALSTLGGLGVSMGMAATAVAGYRHSRWWAVVGGALGGALVGGAANWMGRVLLLIFFGHAPVAITGPREGAVIGLAVALGVELVGTAQPQTGRAVLSAALLTALVFTLLTLAGSPLFIGSLAAFTNTFTDSFLQLDALARWFGQTRYGFATQLVLSALEGLIFGGGVVGGVLWSSSGGSR